MKLPRGQERVLRFICEYRRTHSMSPTMSEIAAALGISKVTVFQHIDAMEGKKVIRRAAYQSARSIEVLDNSIVADDSARYLPFHGAIAAGSTIAPEKSGTLDLATLFGTDLKYVLRVSGNGFRGSHLVAGDFVVISRRGEPQNGEEVVATLEDGTLCMGRFQSEESLVRIDGADGKVFIGDRSRCAIKGIVVGVVRNNRSTQ